jgi:hypothetical protein
MNLLVLPLIWMLYQSTKSELVLPLECRTGQEPFYDFVIFPQLPNDQNSDIFWTQLNLVSDENDPIWVGESKGWINERAIDITLGVGNPEGKFIAVADDTNRFFRAELSLHGRENLKFICPIRRKKNKNNDKQVPTNRRPQLINVPELDKAKENQPENYIDKQKESLELKESGLNPEHGQRSENINDPAAPL